MKNGKCAPLTPRERATRTYRWDLVQGAVQGIREPFWHTFALLVAIRVFEAPDLLKSIIPAAGFLGLLLNPVSLSLVSGRRIRLGTLCAFYCAVGGLGMALVGVAEGLTWFLVCWIVTEVIRTQTGPLVTQIYATNYGPSERGKRVSTTALVVAVAGAATAYAGGRILDARLEAYSLLFIGAGVTLFLATFAFLRMPTERLSRMPRATVRESLSLPWKDRLFGHLLFAWMLMGLSNLMTIPLRVEYMANPRYGIDASNFEIAIVVGAIPLLLRLASTKLWGALFDRFNLITVRVGLNLLMLTSIVLFFTTDKLWMMTVASVLWGLSQGGGRILWLLWVTKIAPVERVSAYMSVHTSTTGLRGVVAPFLGYALLVETSAVTTAWIAAALSFAAIALFIASYGPMRLRERERAADGAVPVPLPDRPGDIDA